MGMKFGKNVPNRDLGKLKKFQNNCLYRKKVIKKKQGGGRHNVPRGR